VNNSKNRYAAYLLVRFKKNYHLQVYVYGELCTTLKIGKWTLWSANEGNFERSHTAF